MRTFLDSRQLIEDKMLNNTLKTKGTGLSVLVVTATYKERK